MCVCLSLSLSVIIFLKLSIKSKQIATVIYATIIAYLRVYLLYDFH